MPERYHIETVPTPGQFHRVGKYACVDWREDCSRCTNCVKLRCQYDVYDNSAIHDRDPQAPQELLHECKACLSCVQGCTKGLLAMSINPEYLAMGDEYWTPDIIFSTWEQSDAGRIPVSGAGYRGRFSGPGFDSIWTDMSEIVRPTRDGIHGREYISTSVDIGPKPMRLSFGPDGEMLTPEANLIVAQIPVILDIPPWNTSASARPLALARAAAAAALNTLCLVESEHVASIPEARIPNVIPFVTTASDVAKLPDGIRMIEIADSGAVLSAVEEAGRVNSDPIVAVRLDLIPGAGDRLDELIAAGVKVFHLCADLHGCESGGDGRHLKDVLREIHRRLVSEGVRDEITLIARGGIALPEHMAKAVICGADLVAVDTPLLIALGCRLCGHSDNREACPADIGDREIDYAARRMINLMGAWHSQLIEVLGAMGIREIRRLRGETGRAMFREDMEEEAFSDLVRR